MDKDNFGTIYKITNKINGKLYVGQTWQTVEKRFNNHVTKNSSCVKLQNALKKYGKNNFIVDTLKICYTQEEMNYWESFYIIEYGSIDKGYNLKNGGANGKFSEESKAKMSAAHLGKKLSEATKFKLSESHKGKKLLPETIFKISKLAKERKHNPLSEETKLKQSEKLRGRKLSIEHINKLKMAAINRKSKISIENAEDIRNMKILGFSNKNIALQFNISPSYVRDIINKNRRLK